MKKPDNLGRDRAADYLPFLVAALGLLAISGYGWLLSVFSGGPSVTSALVEFTRNRAAGEEWLGYEKAALAALLLGAGAIPGAGFCLARRYKHVLRSLREKYYMAQRRGGRHGTAEFGTPYDLQKLLGKDGVVVGYHHRRPVRLSLRTSCEHVAVIGPTGCGKTSAFFVPNLLDLPVDLPVNTSAIVTDPKGEIAQLTAPYLRQMGWETYRFNPLDPDGSVSYNPLALASSDTEVSELAEITIKNGYSAHGQAGDTQWISFAQPLWEAVLLAEKQRNPGHPTIQEAYEIVTSMTNEKQASLFKAIGGAALDRYLAYLQSAQAPETTASIKTVLVSSVKVFVRPDVATVTSGRDIFRPSLLRERPCVLYVQIPERKAHLMKPLSATMYWQIVEHIIDRNGLPIVFFLDEFPNIGQIPAFAQLAATLRSRRISLCLGLQGVEQLSREYSKEEQVDILNNIKTKVYYPGSTGDSGAYVSGLSGRSTIGWRDAEQGRDLIAPDELRRIPDGRVLVLAHNLNPVMLKSLPYYKNPALLRRARQG